ncbi:Asp/Glu racemase [Xanthobacter sp. DSM 14520]|uniref:maleate cis-trans isomerase family protein n=1 Tax=Xanthobacter autotrophicus (strain ATCC BAA-1158 / Py2) TaxID=78245 RepID=UPI00372BD5E1
MPSTNTTVEGDFQTFAPDGVTFHAQRMWIPDGDMTPDFLDKMNEDLAGNLKLLLSARVDAVVYACTSGSFYRGRGWDDEVKQKIEDMSGLPATTTSLAVVDALHHVGAQRISVVTPYPAWTNSKLKDYFSGFGFDILNVEGDPSARIGGHVAVNDHDPSAIAEFARTRHAPEADALFCSCTAWRSFEAVRPLEVSLGKPVITSNQSALWKALGLVNARMDDPRSGRLFGFRS